MRCCNFGMPPPILAPAASVKDTSQSGSATGRLSMSVKQGIRAQNIHISADPSRQLGGRVREEGTRDGIRANKIWKKKANCKSKKGASKKNKENKRQNKKTNERRKQLIPSKTAHGHIQLQSKFAEI